MLLDQGFHRLHIYALCTLLSLSYRHDRFANPVVDMPSSKLRYHVTLSRLYLSTIAGVLLKGQDENPADDHGADEEADCLDKEHNTGECVVVAQPAEAQVFVDPPQVLSSLVICALGLEHLRRDGWLDVEQHEQEEREQEDEKAASVVGTDAVVEPRAVVVPPLNASITKRAVLRAWSSQDFASRADIVGMKVLQQLKNVVFFF